ncbi:MAG: hypothetical protein IKT58_04930 [Oscillospiraceae bacterium]|nr:hypothetical protein [Oscillospiraceae bacterium]
MKELKICDVTLKQVSKELSLTFKEKIEVSKLLDRLGVSVIELEGIKNPKIDSLLIKSIVTAVKNSALAVPVELNEESVQQTWNALKGANKPRLQVVAAVSPAVMEYVYGMKPDAMKDALAKTIRACAELCPEVEFVAYDATRSDGFLEEVLTIAMESGAKILTLCDTAGAMLPEEFRAFVQGLYERLPALKDYDLAVSCSDELAMAEACSIATIPCGISEIKSAAYGNGTGSLAKLAKVIGAKSDDLGAQCTVRTTELKRVISMIERIFRGRKGGTGLSAGVETDNNEGLLLSRYDDPTAIRAAVEGLGYTLSEEDHAAVYEAFCRILNKKEQITAKELDAIVAAAAMQVPPTYVPEQYVITSGNTISATAHLKLSYKGNTIEGVCLGDGPIDAAFLAIEQIIGRHFELDDFQIQSVTEGREAMGQTLVKLRSEGKLYSGYGISTDIVGASIRAYLSAVNKILYEEDEV